MTTKDLSKALPEIVTEQVPGPKSKELLDRRNAAIPQALCGNTYQSALSRAQALCLKIWMATRFSIGSAVLVC